MLEPYVTQIKTNQVNSCMKIHWLDRQVCTTVLVFKPGKKRQGGMYNNEETKEDSI